MSKWRPSDNCIFVIPDIHGMADELELILNRILPLRNSVKNRDTLVFLGDYIDRRVDSNKVVDIVLEVKSDFPDQTFCLLGNHEYLIQKAMDPSAPPEEYLTWMQNGGEHTLIGYLNRAKSELNNPYLIRRNLISRFIPEEHLMFFKQLLPYYETDDYIFVHGGCDPFVPLEHQDVHTLIWDRSIYTQLRNFGKQWKCSWDKTIVTGHNGQLDGKPFVCDGFYMLDGSYSQKLYAWELNSKTGFSARANKKRLVKEKKLG